MLMGGQLRLGSTQSRVDDDTHWEPQGLHVHKRCSRPSSRVKLGPCWESRSNAKLVVLGGNGRLMAHSRGSQPGTVVPLRRHLEM